MYKTNGVLHPMIVCEPAELAYLREQEQRQQQDEAREDQRGFDVLELEEIVKRWGIRDVLTELEAIHQRVTPNGSKVMWRVLSSAYLSGGYDDPNPSCSCDEF